MAVSFLVKWGGSHKIRYSQNIVLAQFLLEPSPNPEPLPPGKLRQPPAEQPLTQRPSFTDTVQVCNLSDSRASAVRLQISSFVKW